MKRRSKPTPIFRNVLIYFKILLFSLAILRTLKSLVSLTNLYSLPNLATLIRSLLTSPLSLWNKPIMGLKGSIATVSRMNQPLKYSHAMSHLFWFMFSSSSIKAVLKMIMISNKNNTSVTVWVISQPVHSSLLGPSLYSWNAILAGVTIQVNSRTNVIVRSHLPLLSFSGCMMQQFNLTSLF